MNNNVRSAIGIVVAVVVYLLVVNYPKWVQPHWQEFSSQEGKFTVLMPGEPKVKSQTLANTEVVLHMFTADRGYSAYMSSYFDLTPSSVPADTLLDRARDGSIRKMEGNLLSEEKITLNGYPGREYKSTARGDNFVDSRIYLADARLYMLSVVHKDRENSDTPRFFNSFKILSNQP